MTKRVKLSGLLLMNVISFSVLAQKFNYPTTEGEHQIYAHKTPHEVVDVSKAPKFSKKPKNIILLIGDGMGVAQAFSGYTGNGGKLNIFNMPYTGFQMTQSADNYITDSAAGGTALSSGTKTYNGAIGVNPDTIPVKTILESGEERGKATGLVSTCSIVHATPASFIAHVPDRDMYEVIAKDFMKTDIDVFIGGGKQYFEKREDGVNYLDTLKSNGYTICDDISKLADVKADKLAGFIADEHGAQMPERGEALTIATKKALSMLSDNKKGFFLMVEGSMIDWGGHGNNIEFIMRETIDFDEAVGAAMEFAIKDKNTLVIVTADHETGGLALNGGSITEAVVQAAFTTTNHTAIMVPVYAFGAGAEQFIGIYQNTDIYKKMMESWK